MSNDPKDATVDLSKMTTGQPPTQSGSIRTSSPMITVCNESGNLIGVETSTQHGRMVGHEIFSKDESEKKNP